MRIILSLPIWLGRGWAAALLVGGLLVANVQAQPATSAPRAVLLIAAHADAPRQSQPRGVFAQRTLTITLESARIQLASTPDGAGPLCTDDRAALTLTPATGATQRWTYDFASPDHRAIICRPAQVLALPTGAGVYTATITLEDLYPDTYGSRAYYLVVDAAGESATTPDRRPESSRPADPTPAPTRATQPAAQPIMPPAAATAAPSPVPSVALVAVQHADPGASGTLINDRRAPMALGVMIALAILALLIRRLLRRRRLPVPQLHGVLYLFEPATREARTIALPGGAIGVEIYRRPLHAVPISATGGASAAIAQIQATAGGPVLFEGDAPNAQPILLEHDRPYALAGGAVTLRYRDQGAKLERGGSRSHRTGGQRSTSR
jgi:hypothetical protein